MADTLDRLTAALADRYAIERKLGAGGMATVYLAEDLKHRRKVALKVLRPELAATLGPDRFVREIEIAAGLTHPHILPLHDSGDAGGFLYYVMPYVEGESLRDRLEREGKLSVEDAIRITDQVASALSHAHQRGIVHRDIKPENILLAGDQAIVADFGIARAVEVAGGERLTGTGLAIGTPAYMSPEQALASEEVDANARLPGSSVSHRVLENSTLRQVMPVQRRSRKMFRLAPRILRDFSSLRSGKGLTLQSSGKMIRWHWLSLTFFRRTV